MGEDDDAEVRQDRPDDAVDPLPFTLGPAPRDRLRGGGARRLRASPRREGPHADEDEQRVDDDDRFPRSHFTARLTARRASARTAALISPLASPRGAPRLARRPSFHRSARREARLGSHGGPHFTARLAA